MSLVPNEPIKNVLHASLYIISKYAPTTYQTWQILWAKQPTPNRNSSFTNGLFYYLDSLELFASKDCM